LLGDLHTKKGVKRVFFIGFILIYRKEMVSNVSQINAFEHENVPCKFYWSYQDIKLHICPLLKAFAEWHKTYAKMKFIVINSTTETESK
jgi:hypothetical protein